MNKTLEKLWDDYISDECAIIDTKEEKELIKKASKKHEFINGVLSKEENAVIEEYVDTLCEIQSCFAKKAFIKGCEFAASFIIEANHNKRNKG